MTTTMAAAAAAPAATEAAEEGPTEAPRSRKAFSLKATSYANGGFRYYSHLPPMHMFTRALWVLQGELEVRVRRKKLFFNRETEWTRVPVFLAPHRGLLFVYMTDVKGYVLRIANARKLKFEGAKPCRKSGSRLYIATMVLQYGFGELHMRFEGTQIRPWRTLMVSIHSSACTVSRLAHSIMGELKGSSSATSVVSMQSVAPANKKCPNAENDLLVTRRPSVPTVAPENAENCQEEEEEEEADEKDEEESSGSSEETPVRTEPPCHSPLASPHPCSDAFSSLEPPLICSQPGRTVTSTASRTPTSLHTGTSEVDVSGGELAGSRSSHSSVRNLVSIIDKTQSMDSVRTDQSIRTAIQPVPKVVSKRMIAPSPQIAERMSLLPENAPSKLLPGASLNLNRKPSNALQFWQQKTAGPSPSPPPPTNLTPQKRSVVFTNLPAVVPTQHNTRRMHSPTVFVKSANRESHF